MALVERKGLLKKFPGKGGWTYAEIPEIKQNPENPFGWVIVSGSIDSYQLKYYKLMPMGDGKLFLPVKAAIRKKINKVAGDWVKITLEVDNSPLEIPHELKECLLNESTEAYTGFLSLSEGRQKAYVDWVYEAKTEETKAKRIIRLINDLLSGD